MRGSPLLRAILAFVVLAALSVPMWRLTHESATANGISVLVEEVALKEIKLQLTFTHPASQITVLHLGEEIWRQSHPGLALEQRVRLPFPKDGIELEFRVAWSTEQNAAMRVRLSDPDGKEYARSIWGPGEVVEVLSFP